MTFAFIGVHRLINKMVDTCVKFTDVGAQSSPYESSAAVRCSQIHPENWAIKPICVGATPLRVSTQSTPPMPAIPLKVMRLMEKQSSPLNAGRMVISGRFADVCAELDRLTERQNQQISLRK
jgi:hypothetical protein